MLTAPPRDAEVPLSASTDAAEADALSWTVHLLRGRADRLPRVAVAAMLVGLVGFWVFHNALLAALPSLALLLSLAEFLCPVHYRLTQQGAEARLGPAAWEIAWADVRHAYLAPDGVKLSPLSRPGSRLEPLRGVFLRFADNEEAVVATVRRLRREAADV